MSKPENNPTHFFGVDVASAHLDAAAYTQPGVRRIKNEPAAIDRWLKLLPAGSAIALESTGTWHQTLAHAAHARGLTVYLLNPRDVRHYARGTGMRGKTDRLDAQVLARFIAHEHRQLRPWGPQPAEQQALDELLRRRAVLVKHQQGIRQSVSDSALMRSTTQALLQEFTRTLGLIDREIEQAAKRIAAGTEDFKRITSVPGIGLLSGAALLGLFRRLATRGADAVIAFLGLDPRPFDSGQRTGVRRLSKRGPSEWRRLLFNAAMSACRTAAWRAVYERECAKGLPRVAALNVLARKLVRVAFSLFKSGASFNPSFACAQ